MKRASALIAVLLFFIVVQTTPLHAAPPAQLAGRVYVVQAGDWLSKIAAVEYGDARAYQRIADATNEKAKTDSSFAVITDPNEIEVGQKLWLPNASDAELTAAFKNAVKDAEVAQASEISRNLVAIVPSEPKLKWQGEGADQRRQRVSVDAFGVYVRLGQSENARRHERICD